MSRSNGMGGSLAVRLHITAVVSNSLAARVNYWSPRFCYIFVALHPKSGDSLTGVYVNVVPLCEL